MLTRLSATYASRQQDQYLDLQRDALLKAAAEKIFKEMQSGKAGTVRPEFQAALAFPRPDGVLMVRKLGGFGHSLMELMRTIDGLRRQEVHFRSLTEQFDSGTARALRPADA
ncbi:recombinase family protein [Methylobacterium sp. CCH5-D2]|uniref:recombinase family protein n=1 Tax=Methylobacterium sp. CCH5-D2 TaxID=1768765 RepID=UPI000B01072E